MLAGFEQPDAGTITISGQPVQGIPPYKRDVNTVFQSYALFPHMDVAENVAYGLRQRKVPKSEIADRVADALDMVKMSHLASRKPRQLSGGQQQRVALARALVNRPSVLLLDEPLGALDRKLREEMQIELKLLQTQLGITFMFVTHDQEEAMSMSDRIAIMLDGHIEQLADPETVYERPTSAFVAGFIGRNNFWRGTATTDGVVADDGTVFKVTRPEEKVAPGEGAIAAVRPECFRLETTDPGRDVNVLPGVVAERRPLRRRAAVRRHRGQREISCSRRVRRRAASTWATTCGAPGAPTTSTSSPIARPTWCSRRRWRDKNQRHQREHQPSGGSAMTNPDRPIRVLMSANTARRSRHRAVPPPAVRHRRLGRARRLPGVVRRRRRRRRRHIRRRGPPQPAATAEAARPPCPPGQRRQRRQLVQHVHVGRVRRPRLLKAFGNIEITIFNSNEEAIQKLRQAAATAAST